MLFLAWRSVILFPDLDFFQGLELGRRPPQWFPRFFGIYLSPPNHSKSPGFGLGLIAIVLPSTHFSVSRISDPRPVVSFPRFARGLVFLGLRHHFPNYLYCLIKNCKNLKFSVLTCFLFLLKYCFCSHFF